MSWLGTAVAIVLGVMFVMTMITEPKLTWEYSKAFVKSGKVLWDKTVDTIKGFTNSSEENPNDVRRFDNG